MQSLMQPIIRPLMDFGECLKGILEKRKVSGSELARLMAYKSRNSIFRILDNAGGQAANQAFFDRLMAEDPLGLTDDERAALTQAMEVSRMGMDAFLSSRAMRELLMDAGIEKTAEDDLSLISIDGETRWRRSCGRRRKSICW